MATKSKEKTKLKKDKLEIVNAEKKLIHSIDKLSRAGLHEYATYLSNPLRIFWSNLLAGTARGLGFLFGATIVIAVISYMIAFLVDIPIIGEFFTNLNKYLEQVTQYTNNNSF